MFDETPLFQILHTITSAFSMKRMRQQFGFFLRIWISEDRSQH